MGGGGVRRGYATTSRTRSARAAVQEATARKEVEGLADGRRQCEERQRNNQPAGGGKDDDNMTYGGVGGGRRRRRRRRRQHDVWRRRWQQRTVAATTTTQPMGVGGVNTDGSGGVRQ